MTAWIVVTLVWKSATSCEIETFITAWSRTMRNCAAPRTARGFQLAPPMGRPYGLAPTRWGIRPCALLASRASVPLTRSSEARKGHAHRTREGRPRSRGNAPHAGADRPRDRRGQRRPRGRDRRHPPARRHPRRAAARARSRPARRRRAARRPRHRLLPRRPRHAAAASRGARLASGLRPRGAYGGDRRRRALHRSHGAGGDRGAVRLRAPPARAARRPGRPRAPRAADPPRLCRQEPAHRPLGAGQRARRGARRRRRGDHHPAPGGPCMRHLLSIEPLTREEIERILDRADSFAEVSGREIKKVPALRGRTVVNLFYEASTRTSSSFELAAKRLSADVVSVRSAGSSVDKGESLKDTVQTLSA